VNNQQFALEMIKSTEVVISLTQRDARYHVHRGPDWNKYNASIGFVVAQFEWQGPSGKLQPMARVTKDNVKAFTAPFLAARDITLSLDLAAGHYVIIPMTFQPGCLGKFWLSVFTKDPDVPCFWMVSPALHPLLSCSGFSRSLTCMVGLKLCGTTHRNLQGLSLPMM
jgi:hypothetical protein